MKTIKTAIASFGMSGRIFHGPSIKVLPDFYELVGVMERSKELSKQLFPDCRIYRSYQEILDDDQIELVVVNTPDHLHYEMAKQAILAGKNVVVEKPFTLLVEEGEELIQLAKEKGTVLSVYQNRRYDGNFITIKKILQQRLLGRLVELEIHFDRYRKEVRNGSWKEEGDERVGVLFNLGSHLVDQVIQLVGCPHSVTAKLAMVRDDSGVNDYMNLRLDYSNCNVIIRSSYLVKLPGPSYALHGTEGSFVKHGSDPQEVLLDSGELPIGAGWGKEEEKYWGRLVSNINGLEYDGLLETEAGNYPDYYRELYRCIVNEAPNPVPPEESLTVIKVLNAAVKSHQIARTVFFE